MSTTNVAIINGISLQVVADEREQLVPSQFAKLKEHPIFGSVIPLRGTTGADGKTREKN